MDPLLTPAKIAAHLGISRNTVKGWVRRGVLPPPDTEEPTGVYRRRQWLASRVDEWWATWPANPANNVPSRTRRSTWEDLE